MEAGVGGERCGEHRIARDEADDHLGRGIEGRPVVLRGQRGDVPSHHCGVLGEQPGPLVVGEVLGLRREERRHRRLGVDDENLGAGKPDDDIGAYPAVVLAHGAHLLVEVTAGQHPGALEHPAQLHLAPGAAHAGGAQRPGQRSGLGAELVGLGLDAGQERAKRPELLDPVALERPDLALDPAEGILERGEEGRGLEVLGERRLEVDDALAEEISLGDDGGRAGGIHQPRQPHRDGGTGEQGDDCGDPGVHASTVSGPTDRPGPVAGVE